MTTYQFVIPGAAGLKIIDADRGDERRTYVLDSFGKMLVSRGVVRPRKAEDGGGLAFIKYPGHDIPGEEDRMGSIDKFMTEWERLGLKRNPRYDYIYLEVITSNWEVS
jgi:hypothetical protein